MRARLFALGALLLGGGGFALWWWKMISDADAYDALVQDLATNLPYQVGRFAPQLARAATDTAPGIIGARAWAYLLGGIMWRESHGGDALTPKGPAGTGDYGHGRGLMQLDDREDKQLRALDEDMADWKLELTAGDDWKDPQTNISAAGKLLAFYFDRAPSLTAAVAAYNAGPRTFSLRNPDSVTTGGNYSADVLARATGWAPDGVFA